MSFGGSFLVVVKILRGADLPKTDLFSKIDPYVKISVPGFGRECKTHVVEDSDNPTWNYQCLLEVPASQSGQPTGSVIFNVYDEDVGSDSFVGSTQLNLDLAFKERQTYAELKLELKEKYLKQGKNSRITVALGGCIASYSLLRNVFGHTPGILFNDAKERIYFPIAETQGAVYLGIEYEHDWRNKLVGEVDVKAYITRPDVAIFVDMAIAGRPHTKVRRRMYPYGEAVVPGLTAFEEVKLDDVPLTTDFNLLQVHIFGKKLAFEINADQITSGHGWRGALNFAQAARTLTAVDIDHREKEIYMAVEPGYPETLLLVDYDDDDVDIKLAVLDLPVNASKGFDLTIKGQSIKKTSEIFMPPKRVLGGKYSISRLYELDDVPYGTGFRDMALQKYELHSPVTVSVNGVAKLQPTL